VNHVLVYLIFFYLSLFEVRLRLGMLVTSYHLIQTNVTISR
jgi:hypothetical protein